MLLIVLISSPVDGVSSSKPLLDLHGETRRLSPCELNPKYTPPSTRKSTQSMPLADSENHDHTLYVQEDFHEDFQLERPASQRLSIWGGINRYSNRIQTISPTLWFVSVACILVHALWQIPVCHGVLSRHFIASRKNCCRPQSFLLSSISHSSSTHLLMNLIAYLSLGPTLQQTLQISGWPFWPVVVGASLAGSCLNVMKGDAGCMGLSAVTLGMMALQANIFPEKGLGMILDVIPIQARAKTSLKVLLVVSVIGAFNQKSQVAHLAHIGGILFGIAYYQVWLRRSLLQRSLHKL